MSVARSGGRVLPSFVIALAVALACLIGADGALAAPGAVTGLDSSSHPDPDAWYSDNDPHFTWDAMLGIEGFSYALDHSATTEPLPTPIAVWSVDFAPSSQQTAGPGPAHTAIADVDGDLNLDLVVANKLGNTVSVMFGDGFGGFEPAVDLVTGEASAFFPHTVAVGSIGNPGPLDIVSANRNDGSITVFVGNGDRAFSDYADGNVYSVNRGVGSDVRQVVTGDVNRDGKDDVIVAAPPQDAVYVFYANGDGTLQEPGVAVPAGDAPEALVTGDFNEDGKLDLAVTTYGDGSAAGGVSILLGDDSPDYFVDLPDSESYTVGVKPHSVAPADFNGDTIVDLVVANNDSQTVSILLGDGDGTFTVGASVNTFSVPSSVAPADYNGDGAVDVAVTDWNYDDVTVLLGDGDGTFSTSAAFYYSTGDQPMQVSAADLNEDGRPDLVVSPNGPDSEAVDVLLNQTASPMGASFVDRADGIWYFHVRAIDAAENGGPTTHRVVRIDTTQPTTTDNAPTSFNTASPITVTLTPDDDPDDTGEVSDVASTWYRLGTTGSFTQGTSVTVSAAGTNTLQYYSVDNAGNQETTRTKTIQGIAPAVTYTITSSVSGEGGSISPLGAQTVEEGDDQTFTITPATGYHIADVLVDDVSQGAITTYTFEDVDEGHTIAASFAIDTFIITVTAGDNGSITPVTGPVNYGADPTYTITADSGYVIDEVTVDGDAVPAAVGLASYQYAFNDVDEAHTIEATFEQEPAVATHTVTVIMGKYGKLTKPGEVKAGESGDFTVQHNGEQSFTIVSDKGYYIKNVKVNDDYDPEFALAHYTTGTWKLKEATEDYTIQVIFAKQIKPTVGKPQVAKTVKKGRYFTVSGKITKGTPGAKVKIYRWNGKKWSIHKTLTAKVSGTKYSLRTRFTYTGKFRFRVQTAGNGQYVSALSVNSNALTVKK